MRRSLISFGLAALIVLIWPATALAATDPGLTATLASFGVLAGTTITNTGPSWITGAIGVSPGLAITGFPGANGATSGPQFTGAGSLAGTAEAPDWVTAYNGLSQPNTADYSNVNLGGLTLGPGVYNQSSAPAGINLTGTLTLNGPGIYIFKVGSTLTTAAGAPGAPAARVVLINGAQPCDIFWQVPAQATIATYTAFIGTIMAGTTIVMNTGATLWGRALAHTAAVTLDTNRIIVPSGCTTGLTPNFAAPATVASPSGNTAPPLPVVLPASLGVIVTAPGAVLPGNTGVPLELRGQFPWLVLIAVGAGLGATGLGLSRRRRRRRSA